VSQKIGFYTIMTALAVLFFTFNSVYATHAADVAKIGVIDVQIIMAQTHFGKSAKSELKKIRQKFEADLKQKKTEIETAPKRLKREVMIFSKDALADKNRQLRIMLNDYKLLQKKYGLEFRQHVNRIDRRITKEVTALAEKIGRKEGYLLIVDKRRAGVLYAPHTVDLTDDILHAFSKLSY